MYILRLMNVTKHFSAVCLNFIKRKKSTIKEYD